MFARKYLAKNSCNLSLLYNSWNKFGKGFRETAKENPIPSPPPSITDATKFQQERQRVGRGRWTRIFREVVRERKGEEGRLNITVNRDRCNSDAGAGVTRKHLSR